MSLASTKAALQADHSITFRITQPHKENANAEIYYTENTSATADVNDAENAWTQDLGTLANAKLYLIKIEYIDVNGISNVRYFTNNEPITKKKYNNIVSMIENKDTEFSISTIKAKDLLEFES